MAVGESIPDIDSGASKRTELPLARLETISFTALRDGDAVESKQLFNACCKHGIFYLDMRGTQPDVLRHIEEIYALEENVFSLPEAELLRHDIDKLSPRKLNGSAAPLYSMHCRRPEYWSLDTSLWVEIEVSLQMAGMGSNPMQ